MQGFWVHSNRKLFCQILDYVQYSAINEINKMLNDCMVPFLANSRHPRIGKFECLMWGTRIAVSDGRYVTSVGRTPRHGGRYKTIAACKF